MTRMTISARMAADDADDDLAADGRGWMARITISAATRMRSSRRLSNHVAVAPPARS
jgi:hypothetical protein